MAENKNYHDELNKKNNTEAPGAARCSPALLQTVFPRDREYHGIQDANRLRL